MYLFPKILPKFLYTKFVIWLAVVHFKTDSFTIVCNLNGTCLILP